jgi:hypothetical protein
MKPSKSGEYGEAPGTPCGGYCDAIPSVGMVMIQFRDTTR